MTPTQLRFICTEMMSRVRPETVDALYDVVLSGFSVAQAAARNDVSRQAIDKSMARFYELEMKLKRWEEITREG